MHQTSFRDPTGTVFKDKKRIIRQIKNDEKEFYQKLFDQNWYKKLVSEKKIQSTNIINEIDSNLKINEDIINENYFLTEHKFFDFPIFVHEMCSEQLYESALLTINIAIEAFHHKIILKDASAWNIVFDGPRPTFIDITSFEQWRGETLWFAYGQFCRHFIIPLILSKKLNLKISDLFLVNREGINPESAYDMLGTKAFFNFISLETVVLPKIFSKKKTKYTKSEKKFNNKIFLKTLERLKKYVENLKPNKLTSIWSNYEDDRSHYSFNDLSIKKSSLEKIFQKSNGLVLDLGCNIGEYSKLATYNGLKVISTDFDEGCLNELQSSLKFENISVCKLNIAQPSPSIGWRNQEHLSFLERSYGNFHLVLCLGLLHHLLVSERIPLNYIIDLISNISQKYAVIEYIDKNDKKFLDISKFNRELYEYFNIDFFEKSLKDKFVVLEKITLKIAKRTLYFLKKI